VPESQIRLAGQDKPRAVYDVAFDIVDSNGGYSEILPIE